MDSYKKNIIDMREKASSNGVYLYSLPTYMRGGKVCIEWINSAGYVIKIYKVYENGKIIDLTVVIERYDKATQKVYFVGYEKGIRTGDLIKGCIGTIFTSIAITHPDKVPFFVNTDDAYKYTVGSKQKVLFICPICGQTHEMVIKDFIKKGFTCHNKNCQNSWNYKRSGENHPMYGKKRPEHSEFMKGENNSMYGVHRTGENAPNWQGGITPIQKHLRNIIEPFMETHKRSLNYTCELTGKNGGVNSHHIYPFVNIVHDAHNKNTITIKPNVCDYSTEELKTLEDYVLSLHVIGDYSNMILLADNVHDQFHKKHGKDHNPTLTVEAAYQRMEEFKITWSSVAA